MLLLGGMEACPRPPKIALIRLNLKAILAKNVAKTSLLIIIATYVCFYNLLNLLIPTFKEYVYVLDHPRGQAVSTRK